MQVTDIVNEYFKAWNAFDIIGLRRLMHPDISLTDWSNKVSGVDEVLDVNSSIFRQFPSAKIEIVAIAICDENKAMAQLLIHLSPEQSLQVVDVFDICDEKIISVTAYKI